MDLRDKVVVVTGGARGIGRALCRRIAGEGARGVVVADVDLDAAAAVAAEFGGLAALCDVGNEADVQRVVAAANRAFGPIDLFCSNAGVTARGGVELADAEWDRQWQVNLMSRVYAARAVVPQMLARGGGYLLHTASAAGLLTEVGSAPYSVTKHADVALAEWLATRYGRAGIRVSCVCPMGVETDMLDSSDPVHQFLQVTSISADEAAAAIVAGLAEEKFLILPHPHVAEFLRMKCDDFDRWLRGMQRIQEKCTRAAERHGGRKAA